MSQMPEAGDIAPDLADLVAIRRDLHAHPELAFEETRTAGIVADRLRAWGVDEVHTGIGRTGVVGMIRGRGRSNRAVGLRADMDALPIQETSGVPYASSVAGKMHACGHDGHTTMLLGAARHLAAHRDFDGTVYLIFQPAEERGGGAKVMIRDRLFERFNCEAVYGLHNLPMLPAGKIAMRDGPAMASSDGFRITVRGTGGHGAMPNVARDPVVIAAQIVVALQTIVSRRVDPLQAAVVSVTKFHAGEAFNVIPETAELVGTTRSFTPDVRAALEVEMRRIAEGIAAANDARVETSFFRGYPPTINSPAETERAAAAARAAIGADNVSVGDPPLMGAEDFAYMLEARPGAYIWLGNGPVDGGYSPGLHAPDYDFNDAAIPAGVAYWVSLVRTALPEAA